MAKVKKMALGGMGGQPADALRQMPGQMVGLGTAMGPRAGGAGMTDAANTYAAAARAGMNSTNSGTPKSGAGMQSATPPAQLQSLSNMLRGAPATPPAQLQSLSNMLRGAPATPTAPVGGPVTKLRTALAKPAAPVGMPPQRPFPGQGNDMAGTLPYGNMPAHGGPVTKAVPAVAKPALGKTLKTGGTVSASKRADGIAQRGKTKGRMC